MTLRHITQAHIWCQRLFWKPGRRDRSYSAGFPLTQWRIATRWGRCILALYAHRDLINRAATILRELRSPLPLKAVLASPSWPDRHSWLAPRPCA